MDSNVFYVWIAVFVNNEDLENVKIHYYIFNTKDIEKFDDINLATYQITDNQKTTLRIDIGLRINKNKIECLIFKDSIENF